MEGKGCLFNSSRELLAQKLLVMEKASRGQKGSVLVEKFWLKDRKAEKGST